MPTWVCPVTPVCLPLWLHWLLRRIRFPDSVLLLVQTMMSHVHDAQISSTAWPVFLQVFSMQSVPVVLSSLSVGALSLPSLGYTSALRSFLWLICSSDLPWLTPSVLRPTAKICRESPASSTSNNLCYTSKTKSLSRVVESEASVSRSMVPLQLSPGTGIGVFFTQVVFRTEEESASKTHSSLHNRQAYVQERIIVTGAS